jgi:tetratricopeptide (TPR) repeat protein
LDLIASGNLHYALREYDNAIADYTEATSLDPRNAAAFAYRGNTYYAMKKYDNAIADCTEAIRLDPNYADAFYRRGIARQSKGDRAGGEADIKAARAIDPSAAPPESTPDDPPVEIKTGIMRRQAKQNLVAQLKIEADANDYAIKLVDKKRNAEVLMISIAANPVWYGEQLLFGDLTRYFVLHQLGGEDEFQFTFRNNTYHGYDIKLRRAAGGTLSPVPTTPDEFRQR